MIGVYYNWNAVFGWNVDNPGDYDRFWEAITAPQEFHMITMPYGAAGTYTFQAYMSNVSDNLFAAHDGNNYWSGLTVNFIAQSPARK